MRKHGLYDELCVSVNGLEYVVFFLSRVYFVSNFYAVAVKMRPRLENWSKSIFCQKYLKPIIITPATAKKCSQIVIKEGTN